MKIPTLISWALGLATACLLPSELVYERDLALHGPSAARPPFRDLDKRQNPTPTFPVGEDDRFDGGKTPPVGIGTDDRDFESILNIDEVKSGLKALAHEYHDVDFFTAPHETYENRSVCGIAVGKSPRVFLQSGIHARERGGPDNTLYFVADLLYAREHKKGITYGSKSYSKKEVATALSAGIVLVPLVNPDGVAYDVLTNGCWRKNRNPESADGENDATVGVDLNRNFDFVWDYKTAFNQDAEGVEFAASDDPKSELFHGTAPLSEPETQNVAWVMDEYKGLSWFLDVHSANGDVLYAWGDDDVQSKDKAQNFLNAKYDGLRGFLGTDPDDSVYGEYMEAADLAAQETIVGRMCTEMTSVNTSTPYKPMRTVDFYPTSGGSNDYAISRYYGHKCDANRIQGLGMEFGAPFFEEYCPFYPSRGLYHSSLRQTGVGFMELMLFAAGKEGKVKTWKCCKKGGKCAAA